MITIYKCEECGKQFTGGNAFYNCLTHESVCKLDNNGKLKRELLKTLAEPCGYCNYSWYVYGCERECDKPQCNYMNDWKDFNPKKD